MADASPRIFLSYTRREAPFVRAVADRLRMQGIDPWFADQDIVAGAPWADEVARALGMAEVVVVFVGAASASPWLNFEIGVAVGGGKLIVPVYMTEGAMRNGPGPLMTFQAIPAHDQTPEQVALQIVRAIGLAASRP